MADSTTEHEREAGHAMANDDEGTVTLDKGGADVGDTADLAAGDGTEGTPGRKRGRRARRAAAATRAAEVDGASTDAGGGATASAARKGSAAKGSTSTAGRSATGTPAKGAASSGRRLAQAITALLVLAVLLAVLLLVQLIKGPGNGGKEVAREDRAQEALQAANTKLPKLYSYDYRQIDANINEQLQLTTGDINSQIQSTTAPALKQLAPKVKAIVQAVSVDSAVLDDSGPDVQVLIFLNQAVNSSLLPAARLDRNRVVATMRLVDGQWKVAGIKAL